MRLAWRFWGTGGFSRRLRICLRRWLRTFPSSSRSYVTAGKDPFAEDGGDRRQSGAPRRGSLKYNTLYRGDEIAPSES